jgi:hypothetical protein
MQSKKVKAASRFVLSKRATALPVSFLMLFVSLTIIVSATYYVSVTKIQARGQLLNVSVAKQSMLSFEDSINSITWSPRSTSVYHFEDSGGVFKTFPAAKSLLVNVTDNMAFFAIIFNSSVGKAVYELPASEASVYTLYLRGDKQAIINQNVFTMAQLCLALGESTPELTLTYRPLATMSETGSSQGKPVNTLRIYIINLNTSASLNTSGEFNIKATCLDVTSTLQTYNFTSAITMLTVKSTLDGRTDVVVLPVASSSNGAFVKIETLICNVKLERIQGGG